MTARVAGMAKASVPITPSATKTASASTAYPQTERVRHRVYTAARCDLFQYIEGFYNP